MDYIDDRIPLTRSQKYNLEEPIDELIEWHKKKELPKYIDFINNMKQTQLLDADIAFVNSVPNATERAFKQLGKEAVVVLTPHIQILTDKQVDAFMEDRQERVDDYMEEKVSLSDEERREEWKEKQVDRWEQWLGDLTDKQLSLFEALSLKWEYDLDAQSDAQNQITKALQQALMQRENRKVLEASLMTLIDDYQSFYPEKYSAMLSRNQNRYAETVLAMFLDSTPEQQEHFEETSQDWIERFENWQSL
ncbi:DUF6279 family lipoprotein [Vibrio sp.]|nr:DUF6279 family lipoprotein [Vibrio sp.]